MTDILHVYKIQETGHTHNNDQTTFLDQNKGRVQQMQVLTRARSGFTACTHHLFANILKQCLVADIAPNFRILHT